MKMKTINGELKMIKSIGLFHTPEDWNELVVWIHKHSLEDRAHLTTAAAMAWNLAAKLTEDGESK
jgi:hypothetical protein